MEARLYFDINFNGGKTDAEGVASAMDNVVRTGMSALGDCWDEYGGEPKVGEVFVLDTEQAARHAATLGEIIDDGAGWEASCPSATSCGSWRRRDR